MNNLVLLCPFHHRAVHEGGWGVEMDESGALRFLNPLGVRRPVVPDAPDIGDLVPGDGSAPAVQDFGLGCWHDQDGIDAWTGDSLWTGERIDWGYAMVCLWREGGRTSRPNPTSTPARR